ncbi:26S protease regulatory subunit 4 [Tupaia chinensis]|uniref:26S protease regulatory subunit 4 n=1 Tax=Tupaia chinensis TaxID=246437 RepID=L9L3C7_TUPCH|nr:26S protease regulatory subunit 4 [Tupaia chinensis]
MKESVELPLTHPEYYEKMGTKPPKGVILYGPLGTGKSLLAKAVANQTSTTFLRVVGSQLIQKCLGDGPKLVQELFRVAEEHAPSIVAINEVDAIGTKRYDSNSGAERNIANNIGTVEPATEKRIFQIHTSRMTRADDVTLDDLITAKDDLSGADIKAICTEAGPKALRVQRMKVTNEAFKKSKENVLYIKPEVSTFGLEGNLDFSPAQDSCNLCNIGDRRYPSASNCFSNRPLTVIATIILTSYSSSAVPGPQHQPDGNAALWASLSPLHQMCDGACSLVVELLAKNESDLPAHTLVHMEVIAQTCLVLLDNDSGHLLHDFGANMAHDGRSLKLQNSDDDDGLHRPSVSQHRQGAEEFGEAQMASVTVGDC